MRIFISHPFFIRLSEQKYWMQRNLNFWYIKSRSDSYKSNLIEMLYRYKYKLILIL